MGPSSWLNGVFTLVQQSRWPEFNPRNPCKGRRRDSTPQTCPLTPTFTQCHLCTPRTSCAHKRTTIIKWIFERLTHEISRSAEDWKLILRTVYTINTGGDACYVTDFLQRIIRLLAQGFGADALPSHEPTATSWSVFSFLINFLYFYFYFYFLSCVPGANLCHGIPGPGDIRGHPWDSDTCLSHIPVFHNKLYGRNRLGDWR